MWATNKDRQPGSQREIKTNVPNPTLSREQREKISVELSLELTANYRNNNKAVDTVTFDVLFCCSKDIINEINKQVNAKYDNNKNHYKIQHKLREFNQNLNLNKHRIK